MDYNIPALLDTANQYTGSALTGRVVCRYDGTGAEFFTDDSVWSSRLGWLALRVGPAYTEDKIRAVIRRHEEVLAERAGVHAIEAQDAEWRAGRRSVGGAS